jgi:hypothetical protein
MKKRKKKKEKRKKKKEKRKKKKEKGVYFSLLCYLLSL